jgi:hypothetical protein
MAVVQLEHAINDFETWKAAFDRDPVHREASGVRHYEIYRPIDDPNYVAVDLAFDTIAEAVAFKRTLEGMWQSPQARAALAGTPRVRVVDLAETRAYVPVSVTQNR